MANDNVTYEQASTGNIAYNTIDYKFTAPSREITAVGYPEGMSLQLGQAPGTVEVCYPGGRRDTYHVTSTWYSNDRRVAWLIVDDGRTVCIVLRNCRSITYTPDKTKE